MIKKCILGKNSRIRYVFLGLALLFALPFSWGVLSGISTWLSPFITINSVLALKSFVILNSVGFVVLIILWFRRNFFCRYLCPVGCILKQVPSNKKTRQYLALKKVPHLGIWLAIISFSGALAGIPLFIYLDPVSVFNTFFSAFLQTSWLAITASMAGLSVLIAVQYFFPGLWCFRLCPLGGLQMLITDIKSFINKRLSKRHRTDLGRRVFVGSVTGAAVSLALPGVWDERRIQLIRPPAALGSDELGALCTRCGSCIKACPTGILNQDISVSPQFLTPKVDFVRGYCLETCNNCSVVCPSGAITKFDKAAKSQIHMGSALVEVKDCLLTSLKECDRCKAVCPFDAVKIIQTVNSAVMVPEILEGKCVGCGACKVVCPASCIVINA